MKPKILLVEDNIVFLFNLKLILETSDYEPIIAKNGIDALERLLTIKEKPDLIISDIMMPEMDGYDFYIKISQREGWAHIPFIFLTAKSEVEDVRFAKMLGVDDYLTKPCKGEQILKIIKSRLEEKRKNQKTSKMLKDQISDLFGELKSSTLAETNVKFTHIYLLKWINKEPSVVNFYPKHEISSSLNIPENLCQLFRRLVKIYKIKSLDSEKLSFNIDMDFFNIYILLEKINPSDDSSNDLDLGKGTFMICAIAPRSHFFQQRLVRDLLDDAAEKINNDEDLDVKDIWKKLQKTFEI